MTIYNKNINYNQIKELQIDEIIWITFIVLSTLNIVGDEYEKKYFQQNDIKKDREAKNIFTFTVIISLIIYIYLFKRNYENIGISKQQNENYKLAKERALGSIFIVIGVTCLLYFQLNNTTSNNPSIV